MYSEKVVEVVSDYLQKFPEIFDYMSRSNNNASKVVNFGKPKICVTF